MYSNVIKSNLSTKRNWHFGDDNAKSPRLIGKMDLVPCMGVKMKEKCHYIPQHKD